MAISFRLLSMCPRLRKVEDQLVATTAWRLRLMTLGWLYRKVTVDPEEKVVTIYRRYFWLFSRRRRIPFKHIEAVAYGYKDMAVGASWTWAHDSVDLFAVGLRLQGGEEVHLFYFYGDGTFTNDGPLPDWVYWNDYVFDMTGTQEKESRLYVEVLCKMIGVSIAAGRG
jgi:hypothetical protein